MEIESNNTIEVQARHPTGYTGCGCLLQGYAFLLYWEEEDWKGLQLTINTAIKEMLKIAGEKTCSSCGSNFIASNYNSSPISRKELKIYNFNSFR